MTAAKMEIVLQTARMTPVCPSGPAIPPNGALQRKCLVSNEFSNLWLGTARPLNSLWWLPVAPDRTKSQATATQCAAVSRRSGSDPNSISQTTEWHRSII